MNCREWRKAFKEWLAAAGTADDAGTPLPPDLAGHPSQCDACRFRFEAFSSFSHPERWTAEAPADLPRRVMAAVSDKAAPRGYRRFPVPAFAALTTAAAFALALFIALPRGTREPTVTVRLALAAPHAVSVTVAGDWNSWNPETDRLSDENGDGVWEIELNLKQDKEYRYQFIINGESWIPDPRSDLLVEDGFGGTNSVLDI